MACGHTIKGSATGKNLLCTFAKFSVGTLIDVLVSFIEFRTFSVVTITLDCLPISSLDRNPFRIHRSYKGHLEM